MWCKCCGAGAGLRCEMFGVLWRWQLKTPTKYRYRYGGTRRPRRHHLAGATQILHRTARASHAWLRADFNIHDAPRHARARPPPRSVASQTFLHPNQHLHHNFCSTDLSTTSTTSTSGQTIRFSLTRTSATPRANTRRHFGRGTACMLPGTKAALCPLPALTHAHYRLTARKTTAHERERQNDKKRPQR